MKPTSQNNQGSAREGLGLLVGLIAMFPVSVIITIALMWFGAFYTMQSTPVQIAIAVGVVLIATVGLWVWLVWRYGMQQATKKMGAGALFLYLGLVCLVVIVMLLNQLAQLPPSLFWAILAGVGALAARAGAGYWLGQRLDVHSAIQQKLQAGGVPPTAIALAADQSPEALQARLQTGEVRVVIGSTMPGAGRSTEVVRAVKIFHALASVMLYLVPLYLFLYFVAASETTRTGAVLAGVVVIVIWKHKAILALWRGHNDTDEELSEEEEVSPAAEKGKIPF